MNVTVKHRLSGNCFAIDAYVKSLNAGILLPDRLALGMKQRVDSLYFFLG
tara:strand:+ start:1191 stop:1340 length:150 start_codon:yes stop_codon:yes gene_type:complete